MAYIEKEPLCAWLENMGVSDFIIRGIESETHFPAVDVEKVVRCKDCGISRQTEDERYLFCMQFADTIDCQAFCSYGTPKERGGEK